MKNSIYTVFYAAVLGSICALLLTGARNYTQPYREANARAEKTLNILKVLEIPVGEGLAPKELLALFDENVTVRNIDDVEVYVYTGKPDAPGLNTVAVPFAGPGLWGPIKGFLALEPDMKTIRGITFHEQEETPGLGGEIATPGFCGLFKGKSILDVNGKAGMRIIQGGGAEGQNEIDGITGATLTCTKVESMLNKTISQITEGSTDDE